MSYNSQTSWRAPSVSSVEDAEEQPRKALLAEGTAHTSKSTADHGFEYQRELMLYFCLKINKMENCEWICGIEVVEFDKFDDIVMEFTLNGENHSYLMQAKHVLSDQKVVTLEHLLETNRQEIKNNNFKKNFALINYSEAVKKVNWPKDRIVKFFLLTNYQVDYMTTEFEGKESKSNKKKDENDKNESKKVISYKVKAPEIVDGETEEIAKLFTDIKVKDSTKFTKFPQSIELIDKTKIDDEIFLDNFTLISGLENLTNLITINNQILEESFMSKNCITMRNAIFKAMETRKVKVVSDDPSSKEQFKEIRDPITREKFNRIILNSVIEVDLPIYTNDFLSQLPEWLDISGKSFKKLSNGVKKIYTKGNAKLVAFMLYRGIMQQHQSNAQPPYCIPYSKLNAIYKKALMTSERKVVVYVESKDANEDFRKYKNAIFVIQTNVESTPNMICTFEDLTKEAQEGLKRTSVKFQGFDVKINDLTDDNVFLTEILQEVCNANKMLEFGTKLPLDQLPKYYINRQFTLNDTVVYNKDPINEEDVFEQGQNTIIQGLGGIGKSTAMIKLAEEVKKSNPNFFVYFGDLKTYSKIFSYAQSGNINIIGPNDAQMPNTKNIDAWQFVLDYFIGFYEKEKKSEQVPAGMHLGETERERKLQKSLLEVYLKEENPKIILFLDGFDEISPLYTAQVIQIINGLKQRQVQMFVSSQSHLKKIMKELKFEANYTLEPYTKHMQSDFLRLYWTNYLEEKQLNDALMEKVDKNNINVYTKKFFKMCFRSMLTNITPSIPLMLNILADIYKDECIEFCMKTHRGKSEEKNGRKPIDFLEVNVLTVYERMFQDNCRKFNMKRKIDESLVYFAQTEEETIEEWRQRYMSIAIQDLNGDIWKQEQGALVKKDWSEVYGRGFITGETTNDYTFIYDTFKEYFAADWFARQIFPPDGTLNINLLKHLLKRNDGSSKKNCRKNAENDWDEEKNDKNGFPRGIKSFVYRLILKKFTELKENKDLAMSQEEKAQVSEFILGFFQYAWFNREHSQLETTFEFAKTFCTKEAVQKLCKDKNLLQTVPFTSPAQLKLSIEIYDHYFGPDTTNAILKTLKCEKIINSIIKETHFPLYKKYVKKMIKREIFKMEHFIPETYKIFQTYLKKQKVQGWMFVRDVFLWYFPQINETAENIWGEMKDILREEKFQRRHYLGHKMAAFWELNGYRDDFIGESFLVAKEFDHPKNLYRYLYAVNSITREDILEKIIEVMRRKRCNFISKGKHSVLFDAFDDNNSYLIKKLLILLTKAEIEAQICANVCGGSSLTQQCTKGNYLCEVILQELVNKFGSDVVGLFFTAKAKETKEVEDNLKIFSTFFRKDMKVDEEILKGLTKRLCESCNDKNQLLSIAEKVSSPETLNYIQNFLKLR